MARIEIVFKGRVKDKSSFPASWIPFKVFFLPKSGFYELELDDGGNNYAHETQFINVQDAVEYVLNNYGSW